MQLRNHPVMISGGLVGWPPKWVQIGGPLQDSVSGEIGILHDVFTSKVLADTIYLLMNTEELNNYVGTLTFETPSSAKAVFDFLSKHLNESITKIGEMDFTEGEKPCLTPSQN